MVCCIPLLAAACGEDARDEPQAAEAPRSIAASVFEYGDGCGDRLPLRLVGGEVGALVPHPKPRLGRQCNGEPDSDEGRLRRCGRR